MRVAVTSIVGFLGLSLGAVASLYLAMWLGGIVSSREPGAYLGLAIAFIAVPVGGLALCAVAATATWRALGRRPTPSA